MDCESDGQVAREIQKFYDNEFNVENPPLDLTYKPPQKRKNENDVASLTDPSWELIDPTPNIHDLFVTFNERFFWSKLYTVTVAWSKRMTTCAGICSYKGRGNCFITLSEPLLKLRPRKDLVETLLHEMIHAFLFVTNNDNDRDGHGPEFHKHMYRINREAGTNITVYHNFHEEVRLYKTHVWRCEGRCRNYGPYFGTIRRATNRAPGPNDFWWDEHEKKCGGTFVKISAPPGYQPRQAKKQKTSGDITKYVSVTSKNQNGTLVITGKENRPNVIQSNSSVGGVFPNKTFNNINGFQNTTSLINKRVEVFSGTGHTLKHGSATTNQDPQTAVRNAWLNKFNQSNIPRSQIQQSNTNIPPNQITQPKPNNQSKKSINTNKDMQQSKTSTQFMKCLHCYQEFSSEELHIHSLVCREIDKTACPNCNSLVFVLEVEKHLLVCTNIPLITCPICKCAIKATIINEHVEDCLTAKNKEPALKLCDLCDEFISENIFDSHMSECIKIFYDKLNNKYPEATSTENGEDEIASCLICRQNVPKSALDTHLSYCVMEVFEDDM